MRPSARDLATYFAARAVPALAGMGLTFLCIHTLQAEEYARYSLTLLSAGVAAGLVGGVAGQAMLRYARELSAPALRRGLVGFPLLSSALACPFVLAWLAWDGGVSAAALIATATIPALAVMDTRRSLFVARGRAEAVFALDAWRAGAALLLAFALLHGWGAYAAAPLLAQGLSIAFCLLLVPARGDDAPAHGTRVVDARYVGYGLGIAGWMATVVGMSVIERALVGWRWGLAEAGHYAAQADVVNAVFAAAAGALASAMMPAYLAQAKDPDPAALRQLRRVALWSVLALAGACLLLGAALGAWGSGRIAQALTAETHTALMLVAAAATWTAAGFVQKPLELRGRTQFLVGAVLLALLLFVPAAVMLGNRLGPAGVALAKLLAGLFYGGVVLVLGRSAR